VPDSTDDDEPHESPRSRILDLIVSRAAAGLRRPRSRWRYCVAWLLSTPAVLLNTYLVRDIYLDLGIELRHETYWAWGLFLVGTTLAWASVSEKVRFDGLDRRKIGPRVALGSVVISWALVFVHNVDSGLADRPDTQFNLILLAAVAAWVQLGVVTVRIFTSPSMGTADQILHAMKTAVVEGVSPLLIVSTAFVLTILTTETWAALHEVSWRAILLVWLACATTSIWLIGWERNAGDPAGESRKPLRNVGLVLTIAAAAAALFFTLGGVLVPNDTAEEWMGIRDDIDLAYCFEPSDCPDRSASYLSVLGKISVLLSSMAMIGSVTTVKENKRRRIPGPSTN
jgi:amino acid transporter